MKKITIKVGMASCGLAAGALDIYEYLEHYLACNRKSLVEKDFDFNLEKTACIGFCYLEPLVEISDTTGSLIYGGLETKDLEPLLNSVLENKNQEQNLVLAFQPGIKAPEDKFYQKQKRIVLRNCGSINPLSIEEYISVGGYKAFQTVLKKMSAQEVIDEIKASGLRGRGGAGFPTGLKWQFACNAKSAKKFVICNADEGDPGAFMDRSILEGDPHSVLEGILIGAYAIGADEGYFYVRAEYPLAIVHLQKAIESARNEGFLGKNILGTDFSFDIHIKEGAGAFVCGEETALMASIEGSRGMPNIRPPFPAESGLWKKPTNINNVETWANVPWIITNGSAEYAALGTEKSKGTKVFALAGKIRNSGLIEVPMGMTLREVIYEVGGGMKTESPFKAVQLGGPSGGCVPESLLETRVDYDSINQTGAIMGSGGMVVMDHETCMVDVAKFFLDFTQNESCGKCTFCRIGTKRMLEILEKITEGKGTPEDISLLETLSEKIISSSLCGLGQTAPNPVLTTLKYFKEEYLTHIRDKKCPAGVCTALLTYTVNDNCIGCTACARKCPVNAIISEVKKPHTIIQDKCIKCGACFDVCRFKAVDKL